MRFNGRTGQRHVRYGFALALPFAILAVHAEAQTRAYVTGTSDDVVTVVDTSTRAVVASIGVGNMPSDVAIAPGGARVYVTNTGSNSISVIDAATDSVATTITLSAAPFKVAVTPAGDQLYVTASDGAVHVIDTALNEDVGSIPIGALEGGALAISPDGSRVYVAAGLVSVIDTASQTLLETFAAEKTPTPLIATFALAVAFSPDGARAFVGTISFNSTNGDFSAGGAIAVVDTASRSVTSEINLYSQPGSIALTPDGARLYVGHSSTWVDTGYGAGFLRGHAVNAIDTATKAWVGSAELGFAAGLWDGQNTSAGLAVTPDRSSVFVAVPRLNAVVEIDPSTNAIKQTIAIAAGASALAIAPDSTAPIKGFTIEAVNDAPAAVPALAGGTTVASILTNDTLGGGPAALENVSLSLVSSSHPGVTLNSGTGEVLVDETADVGSHDLVYQICESAVPANCDEATVTVAVRDAYAIRAENDSAVSHGGSMAIASVLANDTLGDDAAQSATVTLAVAAASDASIGLDAASGAVFIAAGARTGEHTLRYRICETASAANCAEATAIVAVVPYAIAAMGDNGRAARTGGTAVANVLANDTFGGLAATLAPVTLAQVSSTNEGVALNTADGSISVASGTAAGSHDVVYQICETASPDNCARATATVTVDPYVVYAGSDYARASSKQASRAVANVLANDTIGGMPATQASVKLSLVSLSPAKSKVVLNVSTGAVDVTGKTDSGLVTLTYQICEIGNASNCTRGTVALDLSGK